MLYSFAFFFTNFKKYYEFMNLNIFDALQSIIDIILIEF